MAAVRAAKARLRGLQRRGSARTYEWVSRRRLSLVRRRGQGGTEGPSVEAGEGDALKKSLYKDLESLRQNIKTGKPEPSPEEAKLLNVFKREYQAMQENKQVAAGGGEVKKSVLAKPPRELIVGVMARYWAVKTLFAPSTIQLGFGIAGQDMSALGTESVGQIFLAVQVVQLLVVYLLYRDATKQPLVDWPTYDVGDRRRWIGTGALGGGVALLAGYLVQKGMEAALGSGGEAPDLIISSFLQGSNSTMLPLLLVLVGVLPAVAEEMMFRGFLQPSLDSQLPAAQAVAITAAAFAFFHTPWTVQPTIFVLGAIFGSVLLTSKNNLMSCTLSHMIYNMGVIALYSAGAFQ